MKGKESLKTNHGLFRKIFSSVDVGFFPKFLNDKRHVIPCSARHWYGGMIFCTS